ncbi:MAG TPA: carboxylesterase family protein [Bryobacteraceae bacterium]|jgi:para-nitrobenzyl esterase|nr:carboxylesterase family protein [Bryobacteraceae bacterium]
MGAFLGAGIVLFAVSAAAADSAPIANLTIGQIRGTQLEQGGAVFKGIPYAQPPIFNLRWRPPQPVRSWQGMVRDATGFGSPCSQMSGGRMMVNSQEDCLFLNVWTPDWPAKTRLPVMVWFHGGGNYAGTASSDNFDGESLARHGVVLVTVNYRLNVFGFLAHPGLTQESPHHSSGNYGLLDQIAALQWVHDYIARLGGDPANVTIFGQSAGAVDVNVLMTTPLAKGLFHRVIAESGTVTRNPDPISMSMTALGNLMPVKNGPVTYSDAPTLAEAEQAGEKFGGSLKDLREAPAGDLLKATTAPRMSIGPANGVVVDGWVFPKPPAEVFATGHELRVPLLIGNNARERTPPQATPEDLQKAMEAMYGPLAPRAFALYAVEGPDPLYGGPGAQWVVDSLYRCPVVAQVVWHSAAGNRSYEYQYDHAPPGREALGAVHGAEVPYVFGKLGENAVAVDRDISAAMEQYWTNFAKTGNPNGAGLPQWPAFDAKARGYLEFTDNGPVTREGLRRPYCDLYVDNVKRLVGR